MSTKVSAPWTPGEVRALNDFQASGRFHVFTCGGDRTDDAHKAYQLEHGGDFGQLIATEEGWRCPVCDYRQAWAHGFMAKSGPEITKNEFVARFKAEMLRVAGPMFDDGTSIAEYAADTGPTYFDDPDQREEGPEECARSDMSYWGED